MNHRVSHQVALCLSIVLLATSAIGGIDEDVVGFKKADLELRGIVEDQSFIGLEIVGGLKGTEDPSYIVEKVDQYFIGIQEGDKMPRDHWHEAYAPLGALWGEQICYEFGWEWYWIWLDQDKGQPRIAVMPEDQSLILFPFEHMRGCVEEGQSVSVRRIFDAIKLNPRLEEFGPGEHINLGANKTLLVWE